MDEQRVPPPRIFRVRFITADGIERRRYVRCPYYVKDPQASVFGLQARLAALTFDGTVVSSSLSVPADPPHTKTCIGGRGTPGHKCSCFPRWTEIPVLAA